MSDTLDRLAAACLLPSFPGHEAPDWVLRLAERGLGIALAVYGLGPQRQQTFQQSDHGVKSL